MALSLDPRIHRVWRSPQSLQFGVDRPVLVLESIGHVEERMLDALASGVSRCTLRAIANQSGAEDGAMETLLERLRPVLCSERRPARTATPAARTRIALDGVGRTSALIADFLRDEGMQVVDVGADDSLDERLIAGPRGSPEQHPSAVRPSRVNPSDRTAQAAVHMAVIVAAFAIEPRRHLRWLRRDVLHLPVVFSDAVVSVGPLIRPGHSACIRCSDLQRRDADSAWPAMAAQLYTAERPGETSLVASTVAFVAARAVLAAVREAGHVPVTRRATAGPRTGTESGGEVTKAAYDTVGYDLWEEQVFHRDTSTWTKRPRSPHPECGCLSPGETHLKAPRVRRGSAMAGG